MKLSIFRFKLKCLNEQNIYAICKNMPFSAHIDVYNSMMGFSFCAVPIQLFACCVTVNSFSRFVVLNFYSFIF